MIDGLKKLIEIVVENENQCDDVKSFLRHTSGALQALSSIFGKLADGVPEKKTLQVMPSPVIVAANRPRVLEVEKQTEGRGAIFSRPSEWKDNYKQPVRWFTSHAKDRMFERYGAQEHNVLAMLSHVSHQVNKTHTAGKEGLCLGPVKDADGDGELWAVELKGRLAYAVFQPDAKLLITMLPREPKQLESLTGRQRADLEAYRTEVHLQDSNFRDVDLQKFAGRGYQDQ